MCTSLIFTMYVAGGGCGGEEPAARLLDHVGRQENQVPRVTFCLQTLPECGLKVSVWPPVY